MGQAGKDDYSKWNFTLTPAYTSIKQGQNKITTKFSCSNDPKLIFHNSVNITSVTLLSKSELPNEFSNNNNAADHSPTITNYNPNTSQSTTLQGTIQTTISLVSLYIYLNYPDPNRSIHGLVVLDSKREGVISQKVLLG